jgi:glycosyltransferase involved in cell wall biosynthesis
MRPDIVHIHAIGPSLVTPLARLAGLRVVVTHHGPDYDREKWSWTAKKILKLGEWIGVRFSNRRIVISSVISSMVLNQYGVDCDIVPNGVPIPDLNSDVAILSKFGLEPGRYIALVSRFVPEKRHIDLINAFEKSGLSDWKLALVGDADHADDYVESLKEKAAQNPNVVLTGFQSGDDLNALFQFAGMFVLPSSHEGLPISLLEALSFGLPCLASSIPANLSVGMDNNFYFALGDIEGMAAKIYATAQKDWGPKEREKIREWVAETYNWSRIADQTVAVYHDAIR